MRKKGGKERKNQVHEFLKSKLDTKAAIESSKSFPLPIETLFCQWLKVSMPYTFPIHHPPLSTLIHSSNIITGLKFLGGY